MAKKIKKVKKKTTKAESKKVVIELITKNSEAEYIQLYDKSYSEGNNLTSLHDGWYTQLENKDSWNTERYLVKVGETICGYFSFSKYHHDLRIVANGFYILPKYRSTSLFGEMILFTGNRVFIDLGYNKISASAHDINEIAVKLYDKFMQREGELKNHYRFERKYHSKIYWGVCYDQSVWSNGKKLTLSQMVEGIKV